MDLHLNKINIGAVADRAVRGVGLVGLLALTLGPIPLQQADTRLLPVPCLGAAIARPRRAAARSQRLPLLTQAMATSLRPQAAKSSGPPMAAWNGPQEQPSPRWYRRVWQPCQILRDARYGLPNAVAAIPGVDADCMVMGLRISPNYDQDGSIVALCNTAYDHEPRRGRKTRTPTLPFPQTMATVGRRATYLNDDAVAMNGRSYQASAFDIAPNFDGNDGGDIAVGLAGGTTP